MLNPAVIVQGKSVLFRVEHPALTARMTPFSGSNRGATGDRPTSLKSHHFETHSPRYNGNVEQMNSFNGLEAKRKFHIGA